jgi:hypothetical protein
MNKRECAIVSAYTGLLCGEFSWMHEYVEELFCGPVFTHQFGNKDFVKKMKEMAKPDFIKLHENLTNKE